MEYSAKMFNELLTKLDNENLTEKDLRDINEKALTMRDAYTRYETLITITEHPKASTDLINEIKDYISTRVKDDYTKQTYLNRVEQASIVKHLYIELDNKTLTKGELREIVKKATSTIKNEYTRSKILISIAKHRQTSSKLVKEIKKYISNEIKYEKTKIEYSKIINKILTDKLNAYKIRKQLKDKALTEVKLEKIAKTASTIETDCEKYKTLVAVAEHPRASLGLIQNIKEYVSKIDDKYYLNSYTDKMINILLDKLKDKTLTENKLREIAQVSLKVVDNNKTKQDTFLKNVFITLAEHPQTSLKLLLEIEYAAGYYCSENSRKKVCEKINAKRSEIKTQQLKQCEDELGNLPTSKNSKLNNGQ